MKDPYIYRAKKGFTLIELLVTVSILVILMSLSGVAFLSLQNSSKKQQAKVMVKQLEQSLQQYYSDFGAFPETTNSDSSEILYGALFEGNDPAGNAPTLDEEDGVKNKVYAAYLDPNLAKSVVESGTDKILDPFGNPYQYLNRANNASTNNPDFDLWSFGKNETDDYANVGYSDDITNW